MAVAFSAILLKHIGGSLLVALELVWTSHPLLTCFSNQVIFLSHIHVLSFCQLTLLGLIVII